MHPLLKSRALLAGYLAGWLAFGLVFFVSARVEHAPLRDALWLTLMAAGLAATLFPSSYYSCRALPLRSTPPLTLAAGWVGSTLLMGGIWSGLLLYFGVQLHLFPNWFLTWASWLRFCLTGAFMYLITVAMHYAFIAHQLSEEAQRTEQDLRELAREAELKALRAQLNPHFLFNSLNSISALTSIDPKGARRMCVLLSDFLRKSLKLGERQEVSLAEELDLVRAYLSIEQIRFGDRLKVAWDISAEAESVMVPALLLQPLVENAIKHGVAQLPDGGTIRLSAGIREGWAELRLENDRDADAVRPLGLGLGLRQVKQRLRTRYGNTATLDVRIRDDRFEAVMAFPLESDLHD